MCSVVVAGLEPWRPGSCSGLLCVGDDRDGDGRAGLLGGDQHAFHRAFLGRRHRCRRARSAPRLGRRRSTTSASAAVASSANVVLRIKNPPMRNSVAPGGAAGKRRTRAAAGLPFGGIISQGRVECRQWLRTRSPLQDRTQRAVERRDHDAGGEPRSRRSSGRTAACPSRSRSCRASRRGNCR